MEFQSIAPAPIQVQAAWSFQFQLMIHILTENALEGKGPWEPPPVTI